MARKLTPIAALTASLIALPAEAEPVCTVTIYVWELKLAEVAAEAGNPDLDAAIKALGTQARLRGGFRDRGNADEPVRIEFIGSTDGVGLRARLESRP